MDLVPTIRTGVPPSHYQVYLNSPGWRTTRNRALVRAHWRCSKCPAARGLEVHHLTYERLGLERDSDLEVLCATCHRGEHLEHPSAVNGVYLKIASEAVKREPFASIADLADMVKTACAKLKIPQLEGRINSALAVVCGNRLQTAPIEHEPARKLEAPAVSREEAHGMLCRLRTALEQPILIRQMSPSTPKSVIDIYAPVPEPDWGDHDVY